MVIQERRDRFARFGIAAMETRLLVVDIDTLFVLHGGATSQQLARF